MKVLFNREILEKSEVTIDMEDRGYQFGDGVYEVVNVYNGIAFTLVEHVDRLYRSAEEIRLNIPIEREEVKQLIVRLINENNVKNGSIYLQITRGVAPRKHQYDSKIKPLLVAYPLPFSDISNVQQQGVKAITAEDLRWLRCDIKSLNLLYNIMIKQEAHEKGAYEAILLRDDQVTEGSSSNIFIVKDDTIYTHPANNFILNGITRIKLLQLFHQKEWKVKEQPVSKQFLMSADEVFLTSTTNEVVPITTIDEVKINDGKPGSFTRKIQQAFTELVKAEINR